MKKLILILIVGSLNTSVKAQSNRPVLDIMLTNYEYPYEVRYLKLKNQSEDLKMAYMDVRSQKPNGKTIMLLHGKNFNGAYWKTTIEALTGIGYRVIAPDQIGFGKSSKPVHYQYTFQQLYMKKQLKLEKQR